MANWKILGFGPQGAPVEIDGVDVWKYKWASVGESVSLSHPSNLEQKYSFAVYQIDLQGHSIRFASAEVDTGIFAFYQFK